MVRTANVDQDTDQHFRIGFVGHRWNRLSRADVPLLVTRMQEALASIDRAVSLAAPDLVCRLVVAVAEGADRMAIAARPPGWALELVLLPPETGAPPDPDLRDIIAAAREVRVVGDRQADYGTQADAILADAHLLLALWDAQPGAGAGGTADSIDKALARRLPIIWLPAQPASDGPALWLLRADAAPQPLDFARLREIVTHSIGRDAQQ